MNWLLFASVLLSFAFCQSNAQAVPRTITVSGEGSVSTSPDLATVNTGVQTTAVTPQAALAANNEQFEQVLAVLAEQGIESADIQTTSFNVFPQTQFGPNGEAQGISGFQVTNQVQITVRDLDNLGTILDALVAAGSNSISGVSFGIADDTEPRNRARGLAVADATSQAQVLAEAAGVSVGNIIAISEQTISQPQFSAGSLAAFGSSGSVPIASGELQIQESVFLQFALVET
ncbi:outer membrane protein 28 kDa [Gracilaria domingensis]|nr:outer membrane protein 28 kDa [Gracilaria domingensis]